MNLRQLLNSNSRVIKGYPDNEDRYRDFRSCDLGNVISIDTKYSIDHNHGIKHMVMYITSVPRASHISIYSRRGRGLTKDAPRVASTYTVAVSFNDFWEADIPLQRIQDLAQNHYMSEKIKKSDKYQRLVSQFRSKAQELSKKYSMEEIQSVLQDKLEDEIGKLKIEEATRAYLSEKENRRKYHNIVKKDYKVEVRGDMVHVETYITLNDTVRVNCTCAHFYYTFAWYNADHQALIGPKPPAYTKAIKGKLTKVRTKESVTVRNKNKQPGLCKHLQFFLAYLIATNVIKSEDNRVAQRMLKSASAKAVLNDLMKKSKLEGTLGNESELEQAKKDYKDYMKEQGFASRQNRLFGERKRSK